MTQETTTPSPKVFVVTAVHFSVPGRPLEVFSTKAKAEEYAMVLANMLREHVQMPVITDPALWEAAMEEARSQHAENLGYKDVEDMDGDPEDDGWVDMFEKELDLHFEANPLSNAVH